MNPKNPMNFHQFYDKLQDEPSDSDHGPPTEYEFLNYTDVISNGSSFSGTEDGGYDLKPLTDDDMKQAAADDVIKAYAKLHKGKNPSRLGEPLDDEGMKKYHGMGNSDW